MPRKVVKPGALDFDANPAFCVGLPLEQKLILVLFAPDHSWESAQATALSRTVSDRLRPPMFSELRRSFARIIDQSFNGIEVARTEPPDCVVLYHGDPFTGCPI
jgi:hypothetical protein